MKECTYPRRDSHCERAPARHAQDCRPYSGSPSVSANRPKDNEHDQRGCVNNFDGETRGHDQDRKN